MFQGVKTLENSRLFTERKEERARMFKRAIFAGLFSALLVLPAFSSQIRPDDQNRVMCDAGTLGVDSGSVTLKAVWIPNISGKITLDSNIYTDSSDIGGALSSVFVVPAEAYSKYGVGLFPDSFAKEGTEIAQLTSIPSKPGYEFKGFYTEKYAGGTQVIDANGAVLPAAKTIITETAERTVWYAHWELVAVDCVPGTYLPENTNVCQVCPENSYCTGGMFQVFQSLVQGIDSCDTVKPGLKSPAGSKVATDCGKILHIGDNGKLYLHSGGKDTSPSLVVGIDGENWYANTTPISDGKKPMSADTQKQLHINYNGKEYTVHGRDVE